MKEHKMHDFFEPAERPIPMDYRVLDEFRSRFKWSPDPVYLKLLPDLHGTVPPKTRFKDDKGNERRIGWFVSFLDEDSIVDEEFLFAPLVPNRGGLLKDRSLPYLQSVNECNYFRFERIVPFAALYDGSCPPHTLNFSDGDNVPNDALCFDRSTTPHSIVTWDNTRVCDYTMELDDMDIDDYPDEIDYDPFYTFVAHSFEDFIDGLY